MTQYAIGSATNAAARDCTKCNLCFFYCMPSAQQAIIPAHLALNSQAYSWAQASLISFTKILLFFVFCSNLTEVICYMHID